MIQYANKSHLLVTMINTSLSLIMYLNNIFTELKFKNASYFLDKISKVRTLSFDIDVRYDAGSFDRTAIDGVKRQWNISAITR